MPLGLILLFVAAGLVYFGLAHRVLDRMRLTDTQALVFLGLMVAGSFVELPLTRGPVAVSVNVGGALVPLALVIYLLIRADSAWERTRAILAAGVVAAAVRIIARLTLFEPPQSDFIDPVWLFAIIAGVVGYLAGRSRRSAFIAGTLGIIFTDLLHLIQVTMAGMSSDVAIGGAGVFDAVVMSGLIAVLLAELVGESRERLQGGPDTDPGRPRALHIDEGVSDDGPEASDEPTATDEREGDRS